MSFTSARVNDYISDTNKLTYYASSLQAVASCKHLQILCDITNAGYAVSCGFTKGVYAEIAGATIAEYTASCRITDAEYAVLCGTTNCSVQRGKE